MHRDKDIEFLHAGLAGTGNRAEGFLDVLAVRDVFGGGDAPELRQDTEQSLAFTQLAHSAVNGDRELGIGSLTAGFGDGIQNVLGDEAHDIELRDGGSKENNRKNKRRESNEERRDTGRSNHFRGVGGFLSA
eukprot:CAMPEP_0201116430 /NCGR_PEP_ID=MMETSP0850-20130426/717_1 /ASSEMBLY_ACC=CAM_ASM_000622 /TAXON_ID=183588 /ORGANISM="Pseudo-nitzschia fraudulenta, Strain WWA7" /LENGTH=131 /DNA_ID=CAMNT_0047380505 /DNA_START=499 /DNA_END=893 /DNA_ORIENTATION=-